MSIDLIKTSHISYPLKVSDLKHGTLYEGSDQQLYVGCGCHTKVGYYRCYAMGFGNLSYALEGDRIAFRELKGTLHYE